MSHEQYKHDKGCGNVVGLSSDVVGLGSCDGVWNQSGLDNIRRCDWLGNPHHNSSISHHHHASSTFLSS